MTPPDAPAFPSGGDVIEENRNGLIGRGVVRVDGPDKVTGRALYTYDTRELGKAACGVLVSATVGPARVTAIDLAEAREAPGVRLVWGPADAPPQAEHGALVGAADVPARVISAKPALDQRLTRHFGDTVAVVVADTFENARSAAGLVRIAYEALPAARLVADNLGAASSTPGDPPLEQGDVEAALATAEVVIDATYTTPIQHHAAIEPHASLAAWDGDRLTIFTATQLLKSTRQSLAETLQVPQASIRVVSRYVGGGFGGKIFPLADAVLASLAARALGCPVKIALSRHQVFQGSTHRSATIQRIRLGSDRDGRLTALAHECVSHQSRFLEFNEHPGSVSKSLYAAPNRRIVNAVVDLDLPMAGAVRAPGEASGMLAIECAMDELAEALGLDPIELRVRNEPTLDPTSGKPFGSRGLVACMREGASRFSWTSRRAPGQVRDGRWLVGLGMAAAIRGNHLIRAEAQIRLEPDGGVTVRQGMTDIGTGAYTILAQIAAEALGVPTDQVSMELGDSDFPPTPGSGGSFGAASAGSAVLEAAMNLRRALAERAVADPASHFHGAQPEAAVFEDGRMVIGNRAQAMGDLVRLVAPEGLEVRGAIIPPASYHDHSHQAHGAHFAEVGVDVVTGEVRVRRMLGVFAAGRILNAQTARSQVVGGMIWGVGAALMEESHVDARDGSLTGWDLSAYHVPTHADIGDLDAVFLDERDDHGNPMKIKGIGELGISGAGAAIANAIYNACGARLRDYPMSLDKLLASGALPAG